MTELEAHPIVHGIPSLHSMPPHVPNTPQRAELERKRSIRELVFGAQDGVLTTMGLVAGLDAAANARSTLLIAGFLSLCVGALSMGVGEYLGGKSEREVLQNAIELESREILEKPDEEFAEQVGYYRMKGFPQDEAEMIVRRLATNHTIWLNEMVRDEFGIDPRLAHEGVVQPALKLGISFACGAAVPILPHLLPVTSFVATITSGLLAGSLLFFIGVISGRLSDRNPLKKGCEILAFGVLVFALSCAAGRWIPPLFGHAPVTAGG